MLLQHHHFICLKKIRQDIPMRRTCRNHDSLHVILRDKREDIIRHRPVTALPHFTAPAKFIRRLIPKVRDRLPGNTLLNINFPAMPRG